MDPEARLPKGADPEDPTSFTFRKSFGAWWNLWRDNLRDLEEEKWRLEDAKKVDPGRVNSIEDWMRKVGYTGGPFLTRQNEGQLIGR